MDSLYVKIKIILTNVYKINLVAYFKDPSLSFFLLCLKMTVSMSKTESI